MDLQRFWSVCARCFAVVAGAVGCVLPFLRWHPQASFDVLGVGWVLTNVANLTAWSACIILAALALFCWFRALTVFD